MVTSDDVKEVGTVADLWEGTLDFRRRELYLDTVEGYLRITGVAKTSGDVTVGCGIHCRPYWRGPSVPVFEVRADG